jgi:hypothetical protein
VTCAKKWEVCGVAYKNWPDWMKELVNEEQRRRRRIRREKRCGERNVSESYRSQFDAYGEIIVDD